MKAKRIFALLLCILMLASLFPMRAFAEDAAAGESPDEPAPAASSDFAADAEPLTAPEAEPMPQDGAVSYAAAEEAASVSPGDAGDLLPEAAECALDLGYSPVDGAGTVTPSSYGPYHVGDTVTVTATPGSGYSFVSWADYVNEKVYRDNPLRITLEGDTQLTAIFKRNGEYYLYYYTYGLEFSPLQDSYRPGTPITVSYPDAAGRPVRYSIGQDVDGLGSSVTYEPLEGNSFTMPAYDVWVNADLAYNITLSPTEHGSLSLSPANGPYFEGDTVTVTCTPESRYRLSVIRGIPTEYTNSGNSFTFTMPSQDFTIGAEFTELPHYTVTLGKVPADSGNLSLSGNDDTGEVTASAAPAEGFRFSYWADSEDLYTVLSRDNPYTFVPEKDMLLVAVFVPITYQIYTDISIRNGTLTVSPVKPYYLPGETVTLIGTPEDGYTVDRYGMGPVVDGSAPSLTPLEGNSFTMPASDVAVSVVFVRQYTVAASASPAEGGTVSGGGSYRQGASVTVTASPAQGYEFVSWTENGAQVSTQASYSFSANAERSLTANFRKIGFYFVALSASPAEGGTVYGGGSYRSGDSVFVEAIPAHGYEFVSWTENGAQVSTQASYSFSADADRSLTANFEAQLIPTFPLWVGGVQVTEENAADILGDGTASFDPTSRILTLNNATITGSVTDPYDDTANICIGYDADFLPEITVWLVGSNSLSGADIGIESDEGASCTITGSGTLDIRAEFAGFNGDTILTIDGTTVQAINTGTYGYGIHAGLTDIRGGSTVTASGVTTGVGFKFLTVSENSTLIAEGGYRAVDTYHYIGLDGVEILESTPANAEIVITDEWGSEEYSLLANGSEVTRVVIGPVIVAYPLWVGGVQVTSLNKGDILGDGTAKYEGDATGGTLTLTNANITGSAIQDGGYQTANILIGNADHSMNVTVQVEGVNTLSGASNGIDGWVCGKLTLTGSGTLNASGSVSGINSNSAMEINGPTVVAETTGNYYGFGLWVYELTVRGGSTVTAKGDGVGICCIEGSLQVRENSSVTAEGGDEAVRSKGGITLDGVVIRETDPTGGEIGNCWDGYNTITTVLVDGTPVKKVVIERLPTAYPLWVGGVQVTGANKGDILGDGTASFDPDSNTLTLTNANITAASTNTASGGVTYNDVVYARGLDLTVSLSGDNTVGDGSADCAIMSDEGTLAITGGSLTAAGSELALYAENGISITGSTVIAEGCTSLSDGIFADGAVTITDSTVTATGDRYGIVSTLDAITISGADSVVTASGGRMALRATSSGVVTLNDGLAYIEGEATAKKAVIGLPTYTVTVVGGTADVTEAHAGETVTITADTPQAGYAFNQWALVDGVDFDNASAAETTFVMPAKDVTVTAVFPEILLPAISDQTYTGEAIEPTFGLFDVRLDGVDGIFVKGTHYDLSYSDNVDAGTASVTLTMLAPRTGSKSVTFRILPADISAAAVSAIPAQEYIGGAITPEPTVTWNGKTLVKGTDYTLTYENHTDAGTATVILTGCGNFTGTKAASFAITPKPLTVTAEAGSKIYGEADPALTYTASGLVGGDTISGELTRAAGEDVGTYDISQGTLTAGDNYTIDFTGANFTIGVRALTITAQPQTYPYNGQIQGEGDTAYADPAEIAEKISVEGLQGGDFVSGIVLDGQGRDAGGYPLAVSGAVVRNTAGDDVTANYAVSCVSGTLTIEQAAVTITATDKSSQYGAALAELEYTVSGGYADGDELGITLGTTAFVGAAAGEYPITVSWNENPNYSATLVNGKYTITKTDLAVSAAGYSGVYDGAAHGITVDVGSSDAVVYYAQTELTDVNFRTDGGTEPLRYTDVGEYTVYFYVASGNYAPDTVSGSKTVVITAVTGTADETQGETPTARTGLACSGEAQELVTAPSSLPDGYDKVQYSTDGGTTWTDSLPTGTDAGVYTVSVRYVGDRNHEDFTIAPLSVTIKATWTVKFAMGGAAAIDDQTVVDGETPARPADPDWDGFTFGGWYADANFQTAFDFGAAITADTTVYAKWTAIGYAVTGIIGTTADSSHTWQKGSTASVVITVKPVEGPDHSFRHFAGAAMDGRALVRDTDYTAHEGSTVVTLKPALLEKLSLGAHTVTILFDNGKVDLLLTIQAAPASGSPRTGDPNAPGGWIALALLSGLGLSTAAIRGKKRRSPGKNG